MCFGVGARVGCNWISTQCRLFVSTLRTTRYGTLLKFKYIYIVKMFYMSRYIQKGRYRYITYIFKK